MYLIRHCLRSIDRLSPYILLNRCDDFPRRCCSSSSSCNTTTRKPNRVTYYKSLLAGHKSNYRLSGESESDVVSLSQRLLQSEGSVYSCSPGSFTLMPSLVRSLEKLIKLIDEEMRAIGSQKIIMPSLIPDSLLKRSGRFDASVADDLFTLPDQQLLLAPTHEELVCHLMKCIPNLSWKSFPVYLYQITTKYRKEKRPRSGLLRSREFLMKDLYTFDVDAQSAEQTYARVNSAYERIFTRLSLPVLRVEADSGDIGGHLSHEFHVLSAAGQDTILICSACGHAMNEEIARKIGRSNTTSKGTTETANPIISCMSSIGSGMRSNKLISERPESGSSANEELLDESRDEMVTRGIPRHEAGAGGREVGRDKSLKRSGRKGEADETVSAESAAARSSEDGSGSRNQEEDHESAERLVFKCPNCTTSEYLMRRKGIEVGHTFLLGTRYTEPFDVRFLDKRSKAVLSQMGCYGIGVTRLLAASLEALSPNEHHMTWPQIIAPFHVVVIPPKAGSIEESAIGGPTFMDDFAQNLASKTGLDVLLDDRSHLTIGRRIKDHQKCGIPFALIAGKSVAQSSIPLFEVISYCRTTRSTAEQFSSSFSAAQRRLQSHYDEADEALDQENGCCSSRAQSVVHDDVDPKHAVKSEQNHHHSQFLTYLQTMDYFSKDDFLHQWLL